MTPNEIDCTKLHVPLTFHGVDLRFSWLNHRDDHFLSDNLLLLICRFEEHSEIEKRKQTELIEIFDADLANQEDTNGFKSMPSVLLIIHTTHQHN